MYTCAIIFPGVLSGSSVNLFCWYSLSAWQAASSLHHFHLLGRCCIEYCHVHLWHVPLPKCNCLPSALLQMNSCAKTITIINALKLKYTCTHFLQVMVVSLSGTYSTIIPLQILHTTYWWTMMTVGIFCCGVYLYLCTKLTDCSRVTFLQL